MGFIRENARWLGAGLALCFCSSLGQTFFVALFGAEIRAELGLSHAGWGGLYTLATMASALALMGSGGWADRLRVRWLAVAVLGALAAACALMASVGGAVALAVAIFLLRFMGQGWSGHLAMTAMARWFSARRGRAVAVAALGYSLGEAVLPGAAVALAAWVGWRGVWTAAAGLALAAIPLMVWLLARERTPQQMAEGHEAAGMQGRHWTRGEALRHWSFRALLPGLLAPPFIGTTILFQQSHLSALKGWSPAVFAGALPIYAATTIAVSFLAGWAVDRFGVRRLLPVYQAPLALGAVTLALGDAPMAMVLALALCGVTQGAGNALMGTLWPTLYGTRWIGGIRSASMAALVLATGLGPGVSGALIDLGAGVEAQFMAMGLWAAGTCAGLGLVAARLRPAMAAQGGAQAANSAA